MNSSKTNVLLTSAGRRVSLVNNFKSALADLLPNQGKLFTTDLDPTTAPACHFSNGAFRVGRFSSPTYIPELLELCINQNIGLVVPTIDTELQLLANNQNLFQSHEINIVISSIDLVNSCRDKRKTESLFKSLGIQVPAPIDTANPKFPMFIKPIDGSSSKDIHIAWSIDDFTAALADTNRFIHQSYLSARDFDEFTIDMYFDRNSRLRCAVPRLRLAVRAGEISKGKTVKDSFYHNCVEHFKFLPGARGCLTVQLFREKNTNAIFGIEINPRFGGGYPLSFSCGANYPSMLIKEYFFNQEIPFFEDWRSNLLMLRYDSEIFLHAD